MLIRDVEVAGIARLAPMAAISNAPFRLIARECGSAMTTTEEIDATSLVRRSPRALDIVDCCPEERPIAMQLLGCDAAILVDAAQQLEAAGADIIDLNMGCPMPKITKQGKGTMEATVSDRIVEGWVNDDTYLMRAQLGFIPEPAAAG